MVHLIAQLYKNLCQQYQGNEGHWNMDMQSNGQRHKTRGLPQHTLYSEFRAWLIQFMAWIGEEKHRSACGHPVTHKQQAHMHLCKHWHANTQADTCANADAARLWSSLAIRLSPAYISAHLALEGGGNSLKANGWFSSYHYFWLHCLPPHISLPLPPPLFCYLSPTSQGPTYSILVGFNNSNPSLATTSLFPCAASRSDPPPPEPIPLPVVNASFKFQRSHTETHSGNRKSWYTSLIQ